MKEVISERAKIREMDVQRLVEYWHIYHFRQCTSLDEYEWEKNRVLVKYVESQILQITGVDYTSGNPLF